VREREIEGERGWRGEREKEGIAILTISLLRFACSHAGSLSSSQSPAGS